MANSIGSQAQKPLAIVVVGGMLVTLFLTRYLMPVLYTFFPAPGPPRSASTEHQGSLMIQTDPRATSTHDPSLTHSTTLSDGASPPPHAVSHAAPAAGSNRPAPGRESWSA